MTQKERRFEIYKNLGVPSLILNTVDGILVDSYKKVGEARFINLAFLLLSGIQNENPGIRFPIYKSLSIPDEVEIKILGIGVKTDNIHQKLDNILVSAYQKLGQEKVKEVLLNLIYLLEEE